MSAVATSISDAVAQSGRADADQASDFTGFALLLRFVLRRDRVRILLWWVGIVGLVVVTAASITGLYNTPVELAQYARIVRGNSALIVQAGPGYGLDDPTTGAVMMNELGIWVIIAVALMSVFMTVRHTRKEEETERAEMIRAAPVGRHMPLAAALGAVFLVNVLVALGVVGGLAAYGLGLRGSIAFGLALIGAGLVFAAIAAVAAQVVGGARGALALGGAAIAGSFILRAVGDVGDGRLSWLSPIGWAQSIRAFADERWWVLFLPLAMATGLIFLAVSLQNRRDFGAGLVPVSQGAATAGPLLAGPFGLAVRLQRAGLIGWTVGVGLIGFFYGIVANEAESIVEDSPEMADFFAQLGDASITDAFLSTAALMLALIGSAFTISSVLRLRSEELASRADDVLAAPISRGRWATSHLLFAFAGTVIVMSVAGIGIGAGYAIVSGNASYVATMLAAALVMVPAMLVLAGIATMLFGASSRWSPSVWVVFAFTLVVGLLGSVIDFPDWALNLSPFQHVSTIPASNFELLPTLLLSVTALALTAFGLALLDRRDIA